MLTGVQTQVNNNYFLKYKILTKTFHQAAQLVDQLVVAPPQEAVDGIMQHTGLQVPTFTPALFIISHLSFYSKLYIIISLIIMTSLCKCIY